MKNKISLISLLFGLSLFSCVDDLGNYKYLDPKEVFPVTISGVSDNISAIKGEILIINPTVTIDGDESKYAYCWYVTEAEISGGKVPVRTNISDQKNLSFLMTLPPGNYLLNFTVTDAEKDVYARVQTRLSVSATFVTSGFYVLKDINNETDFDYIDADGVLTPNVLLNLTNPANSRLKGTAIKMVYQPDFYRHSIVEDGVTTILSDQSVFHIISSEDIKVFNSKDLALFKNKEDVFYDRSTVCRPQNIIHENTNLFLVNEGKISSYTGMTPNVGKLGAPKVGIYTLHKDMLPHFFGTVMVFDERSHSFYHVDPTYPELEAFTDITGLVSPSNMNATVLNLLTANEDWITTGFAVMKSLSKEEYYLASLEYDMSNTYPIAAFDTIPPASKFPNAAVKAAPLTGNFVYFADGNKLSVYQNAPGLPLADREYLLKQFPAGETVSYITNLYVWEEDLNNLLVLTNSATGWKLYCFNIIGMGNPEIEETPLKIYQGEGNAKYVFYRFE